MLPWAFHFDVSGIVFASVFCIKVRLLVKMDPDTSIAQDDVKSYPKVGAEKSQILPRMQCCIQGWHY